MKEAIEGGGEVILTGRWLVPVVDCEWTSKVEGEWGMFAYVR